MRGHTWTHGLYRRTSNIDHFWHESKKRTWEKPKQERSGVTQEHGCGGTNLRCLKRRQQDWMKYGPRIFTKNLRMSISRINSRSESWKKIVKFFMKRWTVFSRTSPTRVLGGGKPWTQPCHPVSERAIGFYEIQFCIFKQFDCIVNCVYNSDFEQSFAFYLNRSRRPCHNR